MKRKYNHDVHTAHNIYAITPDFFQHESGQSMNEKTRSWHYLFEKVPLIILFINK